MKVKHRYSVHSKDRNLSKSFTSAPDLNKAKSLQPLSACCPVVRRAAGGLQQV